MNVASALWLTTALPKWYFSALSAVFAHPDPFLTVAPCISIALLAAGLVRAYFRPARALFWALLPIGMTEMLVGIAGLFRGRLRDGGGSLLLCFLVLAACAAAWTIYRARTSRLAACLLALFGLSYALFGTFIAGMAFSDNWL